MYYYLMFRELAAKVVFAERSEEEQEWEFLLFCSMRAMGAL